MVVLRTDNSAVNGVEWYAQTLNDALQTQCAVVRDMTERSVNAMRTICLSSQANLKSKRPFRALPLTPEHRQLLLQWCQARSMWNVTDWQKVVFSDESRFVLGADDNRVRTLQWPACSPDLSPVEHVWDELRRQMTSCHSVHDLELAVQDLWTHLPQDNIRCLINSMPDSVVACIAAGGGPMRY
ncbi:uncharacterized protein TNCV_533491 [Trichonephila clavipes]|nr:uncharacterized protein TNCV_533491 [Trichonephila clavipes]